MQKYDDIGAAIDEPKSARMEQRIKPHMKSTIQDAAYLLGVDDSTFVANAAYERAQEVLERHHRMVLTRRESAALLAALDNPGEPTDGMKEALRLHDEFIVHSEGVK